MIVDDLRAEERGGMVEHSARLRSRAGESRLGFRVPAELSAPEGDGSPFLAACLLQAMRLGEDLAIEAPVSARLLAGAQRAQSIYLSWADSLRRTTVTTEGVPAPRARAAGFACLLSPGVDSLYSAAAERPERFTHLMFIEDLDPINDETTRAEELRLANEAADLLGKPLLVAGSNIRRIADRLLDWADLVGAGLAAVGHCLDRRFGGLLIPSSSDWATLIPSGSSPVLDHLFSTESMEIEHGDMSLGRAGKVAWLVEHRPELLPLLKVCYRENRPDNCGRCPKCMLTSTCLVAAGALEEATGFPGVIELDRFRAIRPTLLDSRLFWIDAVEALETSGAHPELARAIREGLHRTARPGPRERVRTRIARARGQRPRHDPDVSPSPILFKGDFTDAALAVLRTGRPPRRRALVSAASEADGTRVR
jgi:hypothetical protein